MYYTKAETATIFFCLGVSGIVESNFKQLVNNNL